MNLLVSIVKKALVEKRVEVFAPSRATNLHEDAIDECDTVSVHTSLLPDELGEIVEPKPPGVETVERFGVPTEDVGCAEVECKRYESAGTAHFQNDILLGNWTCKQSENNEKHGLVQNPPVSVGFVDEHH
eukprot:CAMPEP_0181326816 /NCGR_PEP_ID=MMETSP1101-20121128/21726_1 /TAXON_ID=46948 /ORGANISM="Rhodomonas abbreviata, Strain Caron Lab Isolate" /LENGTH=129 /DNA_ID=CAMNT_0023435347 /DNA_START=558 /DNA_END=947 /DNA_ORIENTATION=+